MKALTALIVLTGMATRYGPYPGQPLYCDRGHGLTYHADTTPWVALDVSEYRTGRAECGDLIRLTFQDGTVLVAHAHDAGPLYPYHIAHVIPRRSFEESRIIVDIPAHVAPFPGLSAPCRIVNLSAIQRRQQAAKLERLPRL